MIRTKCLHVAVFSRRSTQRDKCYGASTHENLGARMIGENHARLAESHRVVASYSHDERAKYSAISLSSECIK